MLYLHCILAETSTLNTMDGVGFQTTTSTLPDNRSITVFKVLVYFMIMIFAYIF